MSFFTCTNCKKNVSHDAPGTKNRNHCPHCLYSLHVDEIPGDRSNVCGGLMKSVGKKLKSNAEESIVHKCQKCGFERWNRVAGDDNDLLVDELPLIL